MTLPAIVMAAGLGTRLRPLTELVPKAVLPIDGRPVIGLLLRQLAAAGCPHATVVTGHLAEQVEELVGDGEAWGLDVRIVRQPTPDGSADATRCAELDPPYLAVAADTLFPPGAISAFLDASSSSGGAGAIAVRRRPDKVPVGVRDGRVVRVLDNGGDGPFSGAPLWRLGPPVHDRLCLDRRPWELGSAFQRAIDDGERIAAVEIGETRDLTAPADLLRENFPYLRNL